MPVPLLVWGGLALVGAGAAGGYAAGNKLGETVGKAMPLLLGGTAIYLLMRDAK